MKFTGQNQDTVSGLYDFAFRRYSPVQGRWLSPVPAGTDAVMPPNRGLTHLVFKGVPNVVDRSSPSYWVGIGTGTAVGIAAGPKAPWFGYKGMYNGRSPIAPLFRVGYGEKQYVGLVFRASSGGRLWKTGIKLWWHEHWSDIPMNGVAKILGW